LIDKENLNDELLTSEQANSSTRNTLTSHNPNENKDRPKAKDLKKTFSRLIKYTLSYKMWLIAANFSMLFSSMGVIILPLLCGSIIDNIKDGLDLKEDSSTFVVLTVVMAFSSALRGYGFNLLGEKIVMDMRK
jgi:glucose uptake protein GlcU